MLESGEPVVFMMFVCVVFFFLDRFVFLFPALSEFCLLSVSFFIFVLFTLFSDWTVPRPFVDVIFPGRTVLARR